MTKRGKRENETLRRYAGGERRRADGGVSVDDGKVLIGERVNAALSKPAEDSPRQVADIVRRARSINLARGDPPRYTLNHMVHHSVARLDASFAALSDATRRGVLEQLGRADASITELAEKFHMTLTGMKKHVGVLERAGLVATEKVGRVRTCKLGPSRLEAETAWFEGYRQLWCSRFDELDKVIEELKHEENIDERRKRQ